MGKKNVTPMLRPELPYTEIELGGKKYKMVFTFGALALAEDALIAQGHDVNLLGAALKPTLSSTLALFAASLHAYHPEIGFEEAKSLVTPGALADILIAINGAWTKSMPKAETPADPPQPGQ